MPCRWACIPVHSCDLRHMPEWPQNPRWQAEPQTGTTPPESAVRPPAGQPGAKAPHSRANTQTAPPRCPAAADSAAAQRRCRTDQQSETALAAVPNNPLTCGNNKPAPARARQATPARRQPDSSNSRGAQAQEVTAAGNQTRAGTTTLPTTKLPQAKQPGGEHH